MTTHEARSMGIRHREIFRYKTIFLGVAGEGLQVVTDNFRHTGGRNRDHFWFVERQGVLQTVVHVGVATEYSRIFSHGVRYASYWLTEMTVEVSTEVSHTTL